MKTVFIKTLAMAGLAAVIPTASFLSASAEESEKKTETEYSVTAEDPAEETDVCTGECTINDDGSITLNVTDQDGNVYTYNYSSEDELIDNLDTIEGDVVISSEIDENSDSTVYVYCESDADSDSETISHYYYKEDDGTATEVEKK